MGPNHASLNAAMCCMLYSVLQNETVGISRKRFVVKLPKSHFQLCPDIL